MCVGGVLNRCSRVALLLFTALTVPTAAAAKPKSGFSISMEAEPGRQQSQTGRRGGGRQRKRNTLGLGVAACAQTIECQYRPRQPFPHTLMRMRGSERRGRSPQCQLFCFLQTFTLGLSALPAALYAYIRS